MLSKRDEEVKISPQQVPGQLDISNVIKAPKVDTKDKVKNINDIMSKEILQMMDESSLSRILNKLESKIARDSLNESLDQNLEHANLFRDDNH